MKEAYEQVTEFHRATGVPILKKVRVPEDRIDLRLKIIGEEYTELIEACGYVVHEQAFPDKHPSGVEETPMPERENSPDPVEIADALADLAYVVIGTAIEFGINLPSVFNEVHRSNLTKVDPKTGYVKKRSDGKVLKGPNFQPPSIAEVMHL